jgi:hypothetical protein
LGLRTPQAKGFGTAEERLPEKVMKGQNQARMTIAKVGYLLQRLLNIQQGSQSF